MLFFIWLVVMCLLSSLDEIDIIVELLEDDVCKSDDNTPGFLEIGVDSFDKLILYNWPMPLPKVENRNKIRKYDNWE